MPVACLIAKQLMLLSDKPPEGYQDVGVLLLRLFVGIRLIYGVIDNILSWNRMVEFEQFSVQYHFHFPLISAVVSVYGHLLDGIMIILGWKI